MNESIKTRLLALWFVLFFFSILLINHFLGFTGPFGFDDIEYARLGHLMFKGKPDWLDPFTYRFGIVLPTGFFQYILGISDNVAAIYPLAISTGILLLVLKHTKIDLQGKFIAGALTLSCPWMMFYSDKIGADIPVVFFIILSLSIFYSYRFPLGEKRNGNMYGLLFASTLFLGLLTKETVWFLFPLLTVFFCFDILKKQHYKFWISAICCMSILLFCYLLWQKITFNDWFYRFNLILTNSNVNLCTYDKQPFLVVFKRVSYELWMYFIKESSFVIPIVFSLLCIDKQFFKKIFAQENFWLLAALTLILSANFWTISYHSYHPLCVDIRHYLYIFPISAIAIGNNYHKLLRVKSAVIIIIICVLIFVFSTKLQVKNIAQIHSFIIAAIFLLILIFKNYRKKLLLLLILIPLYNLYFQIKSAKDYKYEEQKRVAVNFLKNKNNVAIYTAETQKRLFNYYLGFENKGNLDICPYHFFTKIEDGYHYWNYHALSLGDEFNRIPIELEAVSIKENAIYNSNDIKIYKWKTPSFSSEEFFLRSSTNWQKSDTNSKSYSMDFNDEFSPTFKMQIDNAIKNINISSTWWLINKTPVDATLIFSIEENGKFLFYQGFSLINGRAAVNNTYKLFKSVNIESLNIKEKAELKVYIWNNLKTKLEIEDAKVNLILNH